MITLLLQLQLYFVLEFGYTMVDDEEMHEVQMTYHKLTSELLLSGVNPLLIAGVLTAAGMSLYKEELTKEEFNKIKKEIMKVEL